jgi:hypothetical protein
LLLRCYWMAEKNYTCSREAGKCRHFGQSSSSCRDPRELRQPARGHLTKRKK